MDDEKKVPETSSGVKKEKKAKVKGENKIAKFFRDLGSEMKKIVWSPWKDVKAQTLLVVVSIVVVSAVIGVLDYLFSNGIYLLGNLI